MNDNINLGLLTHGEFVQRRSTTLITDPKAKLSEEFEIKSYLSKFKNNYLNEIERLSATNTHPTSSKTRIIVTIIAYGEASRIKNTLRNYLGQDIDRELFEIIILDNHPKSVERDNTFEEIQNFINDNPNISIIYCHKEWGEGEYATVGNARKYVFDIAIMRIAKSIQKEKETILISNDADVMGLDNNYLSSILNIFDSNTTVDALVTSIVVPKSTIMKPNAYAILLLWDALDEIVADGEPINLRGLSCAYRASIYSAVGGYNPMGKMAGDLETGWLIADARNWNPDSIIQFKGTKYIQDPRRILMAIANRTPVNEMYYDFVTKPEIRKADNDALLSFIPDELDWELFEEDADSFWQGQTTGMYRWRGEMFTSDFKKAMDRIGVEYVINNDRVKLTNLDKLLHNYKNDFNKDINTIHSEKREWNPTRQAEMKKFFYSISDSIMAARKAVAENISSKIEGLEDKDDEIRLKSLLKEYKRFAGRDYDSKYIKSTSQI